MKKRIKRIISMFIVTVMLMSMLSVNVMATGTEGGAKGNNTVSGNDAVTEPYAPVNVCSYDHNGNSFNRMNLEEIMDDAIAEQIRDILLNSYPNVPLETIQKNSGITDLTAAEAVGAAKIALSQYGSSGNFNVQYAYDESLSEAVNYNIYCWQMELSTDVSGNDPAQVAIKERMGKIVNYFLNLPGVSAANQFVSAASFSDYNQAPIVTKNEDDTYNVTVSASVSVVMQENDVMTLTAVMGDGTHYAQTALANGVNTVSLVINNVPAELAYTEIKLAIDGVQTANADAFMFIPAEGQDAPKTFLAIDAGQFPVHAEVTVIPPMEISLTKTATIKKQSEDGQVTEKEAPLEGIVFDVYRLQMPSAEVVYPKDGWSNENYMDFVVGDSVAAYATDKNGKAYWNLTDLKCEPGNFLIVERSHPAIAAPVTPVMVTLPYATDNGNVYRQELTIENTINDAIYTAPQVRNDITNIENNLDSFAIGEIHTWIIRGDIPVDIAVGKEYVITDTLDYRLSYAGDADVKVKVGLRGDVAGASNVELTAGEHYTVTSDQETIEVKLTPAGMNMVAGVVGEGVFSDYEVRVYFQAFMDEDATPGVMISNQAALRYTNYVNYNFATYADSQDIPGIYTCSLTVYKHDAADVQIPLSGATFKLVRVATEKDAAEVIKPLVVEGNTINVVYETFFPKSTLTAEDYAAGKVPAVTTDGAGFAYFYGLAEGDYYLIETKAPGGYHLLDEPIPVSVSARVEGQVPCLVKHVANSSSFELPPTGGIGTLIFTVGGAILIGAAVVILVLNKKKEETEDDE